MNVKIYLSSDHGGFALKEQIKNYLIEKNILFEDLGTCNCDESVSYADYGKKLAESILKDKNSIGIGICGTGIGISMAVNRFKGIRGARVCSVDDAFFAKSHNNANILLMGGRQINIEQAIKMIDMFLSTDFEGGRHIQRIDSLDK